MDVVRTLGVRHVGSAEHGDANGGDGARHGQFRKRRVLGGASGLARRGERPPRSRASSADDTGEHAGQTVCGFKRVDD